MTKRARESRDAILNAAERLVREAAVQHLTLDAVAAAAGRSKGGVLYHFAGKEALIQGMLDRVLARYDDAITDRAATDPAPGAAARAYAAVSTPGESDWAPTDHLCAALVAALVHDPALLAPLRAQYDSWQARLEADAPDPVAATVVRLAADGLWLTELLGLHRLDPAMRQRVRDRLTAMTEPEDAP